MPSIIQPPTIEPLGSHHDRAAFTCGKAPLDNYLSRQARQDMERMVSVTYVLLGTGPGEVAGYYTLSATSVLLDDLPTDVAKRLPRYPAVPATLLGRLAVATAYRGHRLGELLLIDALRRSLGNCRTIGSTAVITDAKDGDAQRFYEKYGFRTFEGIPRRLFLPMATVKELFRTESP
jgi:predicted GNAT family N-acyltransferase